MIVSLLCRHVYACVCVCVRARARVCVCVVLDFTEMCHTFVVAVDLRGVRGVDSSVSPLSKQSANRDV